MSRKKKQAIVDLQLQIEGVLKELRNSDPKTRDIAMSITHLEDSQLRLLKAAVELPTEPDEEQIIITDPCEMEPLKSAPWYIRWSMGCFGS